jgi:hypothetical protein
MKVFRWINFLYQSFIDYFKKGIYKRHLFKIILFGFTDKDWDTFKIISESKKRNAGAWYENNLVFPLVVVFCPLLFTLTSKYFEKFNFDKGLIEIAISGSLTLVGINILRSAIAGAAEKLDESKIPPDLKDAWPEVVSEINAMKQKLKGRANVFSFVAALFYLIQILQLVQNIEPQIYVAIFMFTAMTAACIILGRFIFLLDTNFLDNSDTAQVLFQCLRNQPADFNNMKDQIAKEGLV